MKPRDLSLHPEYKNYSNLYSYNHYKNTRRQHDFFQITLHLDLHYTYN